MWTRENILDSAAACRTYREFCTRFPLAYSAANKRRMLGEVKSHCGWATPEFRTVDAPLPGNLYDILHDHGMEMPDAIWDPNWPFEMSPPPIKEELDSPTLYVS
ncbi:hypothetical protein vBRpoSV10_164 [Ruegeria phage vB_RpoS-V10]|nr:hypothetical protein DSS3P8_162 [Roseobacter phage DSS3P8]AWY09286.1 hypothetical protein vBRpoSV10_164 [Ruegeria phage vB_RpoS-V10]